jgi:hypothetical protein
MPGRPVDLTYTTYKRRCKELKFPIVDKKVYEEAFFRQQRLINYQVEVLKMPSPWSVVNIDKDMVLYAALQGGRVVLNIWSNTELEALTGIKREASNVNDRNS